MAEILPFDKWRLGGCVYRCSLCENRFNASNIFWHHVQFFHGVDPSEHKAKDPDYCARKHTMICRICDNDLTYDLDKVHFILS